MDQVTVLWVEDHLPQAWKARASDIKEALHNESFTTIASIRQAAAETLRLIQIDNKPLQAGVIAALQAKPEEHTILNGFPEIGACQVSQSSAAISRDHEPVRFRTKLFKFTTRQLSPAARSILWDWKIRHLLNWSVEADIVHFVTLAMSDIFTLLGLPTLSTLHGVTFHSLHPDLIIVFDGKYPIGVIEVKTPSPGILNNPKVHGQIYDYMVCIQEYFGVQHMFGIVTTYKEWCVFWLPSADGAANSDGESKTVHDSNTNTTEEEDLEDSFDEATEVDPDPVSRESAEISCTEIYKSDDPILARLLCSAVWKMFCSPVNPVQLGDPKRILSCMTSTQIIWVKSPFSHSNFKLNFKTPPSEKAEKFILLKDLGFGVEGRVWMVCSTSGNVGALKFLHNTATGTDKLDNELQKWQAIYKQGRIVVAGECHGLLMPYARPIGAKSSSYSEADAKEAIKTGVEAFARHGYIHKDINIRHTGVISPAKKGGKPVGVLIDMGHVEKHEGDIEEATRKMLAALGL